MKKPRLSLRLPKGRDLSIQIAMILLGIIGFFMIISASMTTNTSAQALGLVAAKQFAFLFVGYIGYIIFARMFNIMWFKRYIIPLAAFLFISLLFPLFFPAVNGAQAWIQLPLGMTIQPSEFAKLGAIILLAVYIGDARGKNIRLSDLIQVPFYYIGATILLIILIQKDTGTGVVLFVMVVFEFLMAGHKKLVPLQVTIVVLILITVLLSFLVLSPAGIYFVKNVLNLPSYMVSRFENTINPFINKYGSGYQLVNGLVAFVKGGWSGVGFGKSLQKYGYLPAAKTDFILAVLAEEFGFLGVALVVALYFILIYRLLKHALNANNEKTRMVLVGIAMYIFSHFVLNVGGVTALIPLTGVPLLLLSSGGSSTLSIMFGLGIAQALIIKQNREELET